MTENATSVDKTLSLRHLQDGISYVMSCMPQKTVEELAGGKKFSSSPTGDFTSACTCIAT